MLKTGKVEPEQTQPSLSMVWSGSANCTEQDNVVAVGLGVMVV